MFSYSHTSAYISNIKSRISLTHPMLLGFLRSSLLYFVRRLSRDRENDVGHIRADSFFPLHKIAHRKIIPTHHTRAAYCVKASNISSVVAQRNEPNLPMEPTQQFPSLFRYLSFPLLTTHTPTKNIMKKSGK